MSQKNTVLDAVTFSTKLSMLMETLIGECKSKAIPGSIYIQSARGNADCTLKINTLSNGNKDKRGSQTELGR